MSRNAAISILGSLPSNVSSDARRVGDIVAALAPPTSPSTTPSNGQPQRKEGEGAVKAAMGILPGAAGAVAGMMFFPKHWLLGLIGGYVAGHAVKPLWEGGDDRKEALAQLAVVGGSVLASAHYKRHPLLAFVGGGVAASLAVAAVPGSPTHDAAKRLLAKVA